MCQPGLQNGPVVKPTSDHYLFFSVLSVMVFSIKFMDFLSTGSTVGLLVMLLVGFTVLMLLVGLVGEYGTVV